MDKTWTVVVVEQLEATIPSKDRNRYLKEETPASVDHGE